jgi:hypothetical protein
LLLFDYTSVAFGQDASKEESERLERLEAQGESQRKGQSERDDRDAKDRETRDAEKQDQSGEKHQGSGYPPQARKVIMVYPRKHKQRMQNQQSWSDMSSQNGGAIHEGDDGDSDSVVIDLDAVTFYDFDEEGGAGAAPTIQPRR